MFGKTPHRSKVSFKSIIVILTLVGVFVLPLWAAAPLSKDDVTLLLIGGASESKMISLVEKRGVDFQLTPDLIKKFHKLGATQALINAIIKSNRDLTEASANQGPPPGGESNSESGISPQLPGTSSGGSHGSDISSPPPAASSGQNSSSPVQQKIHHVMAGLGNGPQQAAQNEEPPRPASPARPMPKQRILSNPSPAEIQKIIHTFAAKELMFKRARENYTYRQINIVDTLNADGKVNGTWQQDWDIMFNNNGQRYQKVTYAPPSTLQEIQMTEQDMEALRHTQPFVLTTNDLSDYVIKYLGHVPVDYLTCYVFSVRPRKIQKHHEYFQGVVWVDDKDLQIVKTEGRQVPEIRQGSRQNLFPRFTTWRQQIDGKFWFPVFTRANDTLYFSSGPVHILEIIRYTDYKQFRSTSVIKAVQTINPSNTKQPKGSSSKSSPKH